MCASKTNDGSDQSDDVLGFEVLGAGVVGFEVLGAGVGAAVPESDLVGSDFVVSDLPDSVDGVFPGGVVDDALFELSVL